MLTLKPAVAVALVLGIAMASSVLTYAVMRVSLSVTCETPVQTTRPAQPAPAIPTDNGKRY